MIDSFGYTWEKDLDNPGLLVKINSFSYRGMEAENGVTVYQAIDYDLRHGYSDNNCVYTFDENDNVVNIRRFEEGHEPNIVLSDWLLNVKLNELNWAVKVRTNCSEKEVSNICKNKQLSKKLNMKDDFILLKLFYDDYYGNIKGNWKLYFWIGSGFCCLFMILNGEVYISDLERETKLSSESSYVFELKQIGKLFNFFNDKMKIKLCSDGKIVTVKNDDGYIFEIKPVRFNCGLGFYKESSLASVAHNCMKRKGVRMVKALKGGTLG